MRQQCDDRGLSCTRCGDRRLRVVYTRARRGAKLIRRRECRNCGRRFTTWEQMAATEEKLQCHVYGRNDIPNSADTAFRH